MKNKETGREYCTWSVYLNCLNCYPGKVSGTRLSLPERQPIPGKAGRYFGRNREFGMWSQIR